MCRTVQASSQRSGAQMFMAYRFGFTQYYETQHSCVLLYWVWCNLLAVSGVVPYALVLLKIDNLDVNELYLYYLIKLCKIPLVYCWWTCSLTSHNLALDYIICTSPTASQYLQSWFYILNFDDVVFKYYDFSSSICGQGLSQVSLSILNSCCSQWGLKKQLLIFQVCSNFPLFIWVFKEGCHLSPLPFKWKGQELSAVSISEMLASKVFTLLFLLSPIQPSLWFAKARARGELTETLRWNRELVWVRIQPATGSSEAFAFRSWSGLSGVCCVGGAWGYTVCCQCKDQFLIYCLKMD